MSTRLGFCFQTFICALIKPYYWTAYRIRSYGRLPRARGAMLVLCNHQHDLDTTMTIIKMQLDGPWDKPIYSAGSRRMFEPGFLAMRLPWLRSYLRKVDATKLFDALGILPIENEIRTRSLASLAWWIYVRHGEVPLPEAFDQSVLARLDPQAQSTSVGQLFGRRWFKQWQQMRVRLKSLLEPYRSQVFAQTREHLEPDYRRLEQTLIAGNTLFLTPEGRYTPDGHMKRLRTAFQRFCPLAQSIWLLAVSYDVFVGERLSCLFRVLAPPDPGDLEASMRGPRPVTVSQLLSSWLREQDRSSFSRAGAASAVSQRLAALPRDAFVDPELLRDPEKLSNAALDGLVRLGTVVERTGALQMTQQRRHPQFPLGEDMVAFQAAFLAESIEALERLAGRRS